MAGERQLPAEPDRQWSGFMSRTAKRVANNLGIVYGSEQQSGTPRFRRHDLEVLDAYYENRQYEGLAPWDSANKDEYIPVRMRKPRIIYAFAKVLCQRVASKLVGKDTFPVFLVEDDPETEAFLRLVVKVAKLQSRLMEPVRRTLGAGSGLVRFYFVGGACKVESYLSKYCYPEFTETGELASVRIQYTYPDPTELDEKGKPVEKWYRLDLGQMTDILYDNPVYKPNAQPEFKPVSTATHSLGFVQAVWMRTGEDKHVPDGDALTGDILDFIDEINYSLSQSSTAVSYNQDPQLTISGMDSEQLDDLIRSSAKAWNLGREGKAEFMETTLSGVERAELMRDKVKLGVQDVARVVMLDPEKFAANAQSGKAMEMLHGPLVELVNELRAQFEDLFVTLLLKIAVTMLMLRDAGVDIGIEMPEGWAPKSLNVSVQWPAIFPMTISDLKDKVGVAVAAASGNLISRETLTRWLAKDFSIEDVEAEVAKINAQPVINPFGGF
jgi:hypothetical protein